MKRKIAVMKNKGYRTFIVMPSRPEERIFSFSFSRPVFITFFCFLGAMLLMAAAGSWSLFRYYRLEAKTSQLETENSAFRIQLEKKIREAAYLNQELMEIRKQTNLIKGFLGLEGDEDHKAKMGQGGVELSPQRETSLQRSKTLLPFPTDAGFDPVEIKGLNQDLRTVVELLHKKQERLECTPSISPVDSNETWISSSYGNRISPFTGKKQFHPGIDIAGSKGTPICSTAKGKVIFVGENGAMGLTVKIKHGSLYKTMYGHLLKAAVEKNQSVARGEIIGYMGHSGRTTGYHVHYGIQKKGRHMNPYPLMLDWKGGAVTLAVGRD